MQMDGFCTDGAVLQLAAQTKTLAKMMGYLEQITKAASSRRKVRDVGLEEAMQHLCADFSVLPIASQTEPADE